VHFFIKQKPLVLQAIHAIFCLKKSTPYDVLGSFGLTTPKVGKIAKYSQVIEQKVRQNQK
jgi:hypothetical protein